MAWGIQAGTPASDPVKWIHPPSVMPFNLEPGPRVLVLDRLKRRPLLVFQCILDIPASVPTHTHTHTGV